MVNEPRQCVCVFVSVCVHVCVCIHVCVCVCASMCVLGICACIPQPFAMLRSLTMTEARFFFFFNPTTQAAVSTTAFVDQSNYRSVFDFDFAGKMLKWNSSFIGVTDHDMEEFVLLCFFFHLIVCTRKG